MLTERLLRQNAELTGFVSRLTEEKNELRNQLLRLEEELRRLRHLKTHSVSARHFNILKNTVLKNIRETDSNHSMAQEFRH